MVNNKILKKKITKKQSSGQGSYLNESYMLFLAKDKRYVRTVNVLWYIWATVTRNIVGKISLCYQKNVW